MREIRLVFVMSVLIIYGIINAQDNSQKEITVRKEILPVSEKVAEFTKLGEIIAFSQQKNYDPTGATVYYSFHTIETMLDKENPPMYFELSHGLPNDPNYYKNARYRVIYMTKPLVAEQFSAPPNFSGGYTSEVYVIGVLISDSNNAPKLSQWVALSSVSIDFENRNN